MKEVTMRVHYFQHVPFEGLGSIEPWLKNHSAQISTTKFYNQDSLPEVNEIDALIIMGGPMSVNDEHRYPWLREEMEFIATAIKKGKVVLGICLGAQLIAKALGARVYPNAYKEIGWFPVEKSTATANSVLSDCIPSSMEVFHWHGETFDIPPAALHLAQSKACVNQAFCVGEKVLGLQFHLEVTPGSLSALIENCRSDITAEPYVQSEEEMFVDSRRFERVNTLMDTLLRSLLLK